MCCASVFDFKNMVKILKENEYSLIRKKGSHFIYSNGIKAGDSYALCIKRYSWLLLGV